MVDPVEIGLYETDRLKPQSESRSPPELSAGTSTVNVG